MSLDNPNPKVKTAAPQTSTNVDISDEAAELFEYIRDIKDPEHDYTLEQLNVISENQITVVDDGYGTKLIDIEFTPTVPHCSLASLIALSIREKLRQELPGLYKLRIYITPGSHSTEHEINKQVNDKERVAAAMENPNLKRTIEQCIHYKRSEY